MKHEGGEGSKGQKGKEIGLEVGQRAVNWVVCCTQNKQEVMGKSKELEALNSRAIGCSR